MNPHLGSSFDDFLAEEALLEELYVGGYSSTTRPYQPEPRTERDHASSFSLIS